jgi:hypothetical protein
MSRQGFLTVPRQRADTERMGRLLAYALMLALAALCAAQSGAADGNGLTQQEVSGLPVSVALPTSWQFVVVPSSVSPAVLKQLVAIDPAASMLAYPSVRQAGIRLLANEPAQKGHFAANINLIVKPLPRGFTLRAWFFGGSSAALQYVGTTTRISSNNTPGLHYQSTKVQKYGAVPLLTDVYAFAYNGDVYDFTYTSLASDARRYLPTFVASGRSIYFATP